VRILDITKFDVLRKKRIELGPQLLHLAAKCFGQVAHRDIKRR
jgi:hypothetical protein